MQKCKIFSLTICSSNNFTKSEIFYLKALEQTLSHFNGIIDKKSHSLQMYLSENTFLIGSRSTDNKINPFAFVDEEKYYSKLM